MRIRKQKSDEGAEEKEIRFHKGQDEKETRNRCEKMSKVHNNQGGETETEVAGVIIPSDITLVKRHRCKESKE